MSEHAWVQENIASYVAGGLEPAERERLLAEADEGDADAQSGASMSIAETCCRPGARHARAS